MKRPRRRRVRLGMFEFYDPALLCGALYVLLYFDSSRFLRLGLLAAVLHEAGHITVFYAIKRRWPVVAVTAAGFCMRTRGEKLTPRQTFWLAAAGPATNALLALLWAAKVSRRATVYGSAFLAANVLTGAFNLLPIAPLDGAQLLSSARDMLRQRRAK